MDVTITEKDYESALGDSDVKILVSKKREAVLGPEPTVAIIDALPRVFADRVRKMIPPDYEVREITIAMKISGTPFGVGVGGDATVKFGPKK